MITDSTLPNPVVLVDDSETDLFFARRLLVRAGVLNPLSSFQSSRDAWAALSDLATRPEADEFPSAILLDGNMPGLDGFTLLQALRAVPAFAHTKIIMISGSQNSQDRERAIQLGADAYFVKYPPATALAEALLGVTATAG